jgi:RNA polymerase sigma-70 factor (ECF subfamily)
MAGGNHADAADVLQEAFVKAFVNIKRFRGDSSFATWIWRIVRNEFINYRKALGTKALPHDEDSADHLTAEGRNTAEEEVILSERKAHLLATVALLPPKYRETLVMIDIREQSYEETAELLDLSMSALKTRLMRAREKLSELIRKRRKYFL